MVNTVSASSSPITGAFGRKVVLGLAVGASMIWASNSESVVDFLFGFNDEPAAYYDPADFPLRASRHIGVDEWIDIPVPSGVKQPSGLTVRSGEVAIITDMAMVHKGNLRIDTPAMITETDSKLLLKKPLLFRQGHFEALSFGPTSDEMFAAGGGNTLYRLSSAGGDLKITDTWVLDLPHDGNSIPEIQGMAYRAETDTLFVGFSPEEDAGIKIAEYSSAGQFLGLMDLSLPGTDTDELSQILKRTNVTGLAIYGSHLIILSDRHSGLLWIDLVSSQITDIWTYGGVTDTSAIAMDDGKLFLMQDHEYFEAAPPLRVLDISSKFSG